MARLKREEMKSLFAEAQEKAQETTAQKDYPKLPEGRYRAQLKADYYEARSGKKNIRHHWTPTDGEFEGETFIDFRNIESSLGISYTLKEWAKLGIDTSNIADYEDMVDMAEEVSAMEPICLLTVKTNAKNPQFQNFYIDEVLEISELGDVDEEVEDEADAEDEDEDEDIFGEDSDDEIEIGDKVAFIFKKKEVVAEVIGYNEEEGEVIVRRGKSELAVAVDKILRKVE